MPSKGKAKTPGTMFSHAPFELTAKESSYRFLAASPTFKAFVREHPDIFSATHKMIQGNRSALRAGKEIIDNEQNIRIQRAATGSYPGRNRFGTLRVRVSGKEFFVKLSKTERVAVVFETYRRMDAHLKQRKYRIGQFNVRVLAPKLLYANGLEYYLVSDFYSPESVVQVRDTSRAMQKRAERVFRELYRSDLGLCDIGSGNSFYHKKSNTLLLFDFLLK
ncbi:hypothetical protein KKE06_05785 [Candidatus Micrarchaeota archaeon]|nr:hypothetical protein [Candidatus Micrarchaeota archaeon]MBU1931004.1 hypothetical protein [Candidatus Micrarchaeota archaeon]